MKNKTHLLIVDDDERLRDLLKQYLIENDFLVSTASHADEAREILKIFSFDLMILDIMMPNETGIQFMKSLRGSSGKIKNIPILLLTATGEIEQRLEGFTKGADDYLTKPFDPRELLLRIHAILKRTQNTSSNKEIKLGNAIFHLSINHLEKNGIPVSLTTVESVLLKTFSTYSGQTLTREDLIAACEGELNPRTVDVQITRLRRKIEENPKIPRYLQTIRGKGYVLIPDQ